MDRFRSLTARLVLTTVALVALVCLLIAGATTLAMRAYLNGRLDDEVREAVSRTLTDRPGPGDEPRRFTAVGSLRANFPEGQAANGYVITAQGDEPPHREDLGSDQLATLDEIPADGDAHDADVPDLGEYRVIATRVTFVMEGGTTASGVIVVGLPSDEVDGIISSLVGWEALLTLLGVVAAGSAALVVVRRQLRPLREVAATAHAVSELPLASGAIALEERVPAHLTDERTEVGQVGSALNAMLDHVGSSLEARHRSEQQVRQFVADASHELRTPLTTIAGYTELARSRPDDRAAADTALAKVEEESGRMTALVEDLLLLARLDSGRPLVSEPVDLARLLVEAVSDARVLAPDHRWRLSLPESSVEVVGDEPRLHQVVTNLLTNARKYTPAGTTVTVSVHPGGFAVHDDGPGFPPDLVDNAFERFARGDAARTRAGDELKVGGGYGLGLSLVEAIVTAHGGRVHLRSVPGDTTVTVELPPLVEEGALAPRLETR
jgi:two-component system OmpR family sensor kinase